MTVLCCLAVSYCSILHLIDQALLCCIRAAYVVSMQLCAPSASAPFLAQTCMRQSARFNMSPRTRRCSQQTRWSLPTPPQIASVKCFLLLGLSSSKLGASVQCSTAACRQQGGLRRDQAWA